MNFVENMDARGHRCSSQGGDLKLFKGVMVVFEGEISYDLYRLVREVLVTGAAKGASTTHITERTP